MNESIYEFIKPDARKITLSFFLLFPLVFVTDMDFSYLDFLEYLIEDYAISCALVEGWDRIINKKPAA